MEFIISKPKYRANVLPQKAEVLRCLELKVEELISSHVSKRKLWFSSDFIPTEEKMNDEQASIKTKLKERAKGIKDQVRVARG